MSKIVFFGSRICEGGFDSILSRKIGEEDKSEVLISQSRFYE